MARNILKSDAVKGLTIFDTSEPNIEKFVWSSNESLRPKLSLASSLDEVALNSDFIGLSLPSEMATEAVLFGPNGLIPSLDSPHAHVTTKRPIILDHGTFTRHFVIRSAQRAADAGISYLDAPVSGGPSGADQGSLTIMIGGSKADVEQSTAILKTYSANIFHFGDSGSGMAAKLINQALVGMHAQAACEALLLAEKFHLENTDVLLNMLKTSWGQSKLLELTIADYIKARQLGWTSVQNSSAPLRNLQKDFSSVIADTCPQPSVAQSELPLTYRTGQAIELACKSGLGNDAFLSLMKLLSTEGPK